MKLLATCRWVPRSSAARCLNKCALRGVIRSASASVVVTTCGGSTGESIIVAPHSHDIFQKQISPKAQHMANARARIRSSLACVSRGNRVALLRRSIKCFLHQTYPYRELVVVYESDDEATRQFLTALGESSIHPLEVPAVPRLTLGSLRNIALQAGTGTYVAQWDDDDWYSPERLAEQMRAIQETGKQGCVLARWSCTTA